MNPILETIDKASKLFLSEHATLNLEKIENFKIEDAESARAFFKPPDYLAALLETIDREDAYRVIHAFNAINASLQYCFFLGSSTVRFDGIDSAWVMRMIDGVFRECGICSTRDIYAVKEHIIEALIASNITLLDKRVETVNEVFERLDFVRYGERYLDVDASIDLLSRLVCFKRDIFFKKGIFAVGITGRMLLDLRRNHRDYREQFERLPVPADYQIPKMLRHFGLIEFSPELAHIIDSDQFIPENSVMELGIRAATVQACGLIAEYNGVCADDVDGWLFMRRGESGERHHLCVTVSY